MKHTTESGHEVEIVEASIEGGKMIVSQFVWDGDIYEPSEPVEKERIGDEILKILGRKYNDLRDNPLLETDLRELDEFIIKKKTQKADILVCMAGKSLPTSNDIKEDSEVNKDSVSAHLTEMRRRGLIAILDTDGSGSYRYVLTHVGAKEAMRLKHS